VLGFMEEEELNLSEEVVEVAPGDCLFLYTDGLCDVESPGRHGFGLPALKSLFSAQVCQPGAQAHRHPRETCQAVFDALKRFQAGAEQADDMTLLVMEVYDESS
jgi:serine phosphatase RsbU (regulator of sigma subunit)